MYFVYPTCYKVACYLHPFFRTPNIYRVNGTVNNITTLTPHFRPERNQENYFRFRVYPINGSL